MPHLITPMRGGRVAAAGLAVAAAAAVATPAALAGGSGRAPSLRRIDLVSDQPGHARKTDPNLVNPWGLAFGPTTPIWVSDNGTDKSTLYMGTNPPSIVPLVVNIPGGKPTGQVYNPTSGFVLRSGKDRKPALFIFDSEAGRITAWAGLGDATQAQSEAMVPGAIFKGLAIAGKRLYATDFHHGRVDVFNSKFHRIHVAGAFRDRRLPDGYAPFGIEAIRDRIVVTYAKQDADAEDDVKGAGHGFVDVFTRNGFLVRRLISRGALDSPWGLVIAPKSFGRLAGDLLVGNFGDGRIHAYDRRTGALRATLRNSAGRPFAIDGLWALEVGNGVFGDRGAVIFSAGPDDEAHGLLGELVRTR